MISANGKDYAPSQISAMILQNIKITAEDAPLVYYKMVSAFDYVGVTIQQAVITTIGHQVIDTFYITPSDHKKIVKSDFEESLKQVLMSPSVI